MSIYDFQSSVPVFDGLLDFNNNDHRGSPFRARNMHGLAKPRLLAESTVHSLESSITRLGIVLRKFQLTTCAEFVTRNLPQEAARGRRKAAKAKLQTTTKNQNQKGKRRPRGWSRSPRNYEFVSLATRFRFMNHHP